MAGTTREDMLTATARLLQNRGYHGTSLSHILAESGAPRGSLYFHFPGGKDQLVLEATQAASNETTRALTKDLGHVEGPAQGVRRFVEGLARNLEESGCESGCPVAPLILDASGGNEKLAEVCRKAFEDWAEVMKVAFVDAGIPARKASRLAWLVLSTVEGMLIIARARHDPSLLTSAGGEIETLILDAETSGVSASASA